MAEASIVPRGEAGSSSEAELIRRARAQDAIALREIMQRNSPKLFRLARSVLGNESEAEDVLQETYLRAFRNLSEFRGEAALSTWLTRIALNEALGRLRRARPTVELSQAENRSSADLSKVIPFPLQAEGVDPEVALARKQMAGLLEAAVDQLPETFRVVFVLRCIQEMSVEATARTLGLNEATVKTRLHRARLLLRKSLEAEIGSALKEAFPFAGLRCARISGSVLTRLGLGAAG